MILYKRNSQGKPIFWKIQDIGHNTIEVCYGLVGKEGRTETYNTHRKVTDEIKSAINSKRKEGYKELSDLYDNAPKSCDNLVATYEYLNTYLPKFNTHEDGRFIPMLCKTLEDNKPFEKHIYSGQWKINGERCIITAFKDDDLFQNVHLNYRSREGVDWTDKLCYLDEYLLPNISQTMLDMMIEEGVGLDGELYLPGYTINDINSFIKNTELPQHYKLQYWMYDICIPDMSAIARYCILETNFENFIPKTMNKEIHLNYIKPLILLPNYNVLDFTDAVHYRDEFIDMGFEGLVIRDNAASYQFGGRRNQSMMKFKRKEDGKFVIVNIIPEGKRTNLPKFVCRNDINDELFEVTLNKPQAEQEEILIHKNDYINKLILVEFRERSGVKEVPFHAKGIRILS
uniref:DNA ligase n=1 Tax=Geladintestivirus 6 TaxID=3233138 RepID=A0AAU8MJA0_9CAUD